MKQNRYNRTITSFLTIALFAAIASAQTTEFAYQCRLMDGSIAVNVVYDFEFSLLDDVVGLDFTAFHKDSIFRQI